MTADGADPGTVRPGGRTARVREAVLRAAGDALAEHGFAHLDLADVARRAAGGGGRGQGWVPGRHAPAGGDPRRPRAALPPPAPRRGAARRARPGPRARRGGGGRASRRLRDLTRSFAYGRSTAQPKSA